MARGFQREGEQVVAVLDAQERQFVVSLLDQTQRLLSQSANEFPVDEFEALMLDAGMTGVANGEEREDGSQRKEAADPALERLLPAGHRGDDRIAAEFRRLTAAGLRHRKSAQLAVAADVLRSAGSDRVAASGDQAQAVLVALTDVRLVLAQRLGIETDEDADELHRRVDQMPAEDPRLGLSIAYDFLTWLQETLISALSP